MELSDLFVTMRTDEGVPTTTVMIALAGGQGGDDLHCALDDALDLGQRLLNPALHLFKRLGRRHPLRADALETFGKRMLHLCGEVNYVARMTQMTILP